MYRSLRLKGLKGLRLEGFKVEGSWGRKDFGLRVSDRFGGERSTEGEGTKTGLAFW